MNNSLLLLKAVRPLHDDESETTLTFMANENPVLYRTSRVPTRMGK